MTRNSKLSPLQGVLLCINRDMILNILLIFLCAFHPLLHMHKKKKTPQCIPWCSVDAKLSFLFLFHVP